MALDTATAPVPRTRKTMPEGYRQIERKVATLYPPVAPDLMTGMLSNPNVPFGIGNREVRVRLGKIELWERISEFNG